VGKNRDKREESIGFFLTKVSQNPQLFNVSRFLSVPQAESKVAAMDNGKMSFFIVCFFGVKGNTYRVVELV
jgi:hypothetical protein